MVTNQVLRSMRREWAAALASNGDFAESERSGASKNGWWA